jgi:hypothetical protein
MKALVVTLLVLFFGGQAVAQSPVIVALGKWELHGDKLVLVIPMGDTLTQKQRSMIDGGFTTVSQLSLTPPVAEEGDVDPERIPVFYRVRCSVKFDAWEELYDVARLDEAPRTGLVKHYGDYGEMCLKAEVDDPDLLARLAPTGGSIRAELIVKQTSPDEASRIKDWLIQQQSGVMQSLFSHMLGELTLHQTAIVRISVPPKPQVVEQTQKPAVPPSAVGKG